MSGRYSDVVFKVWPHGCRPSQLVIHAPDQLFCRELGYKLDHSVEEVTYFVHNRRKTGKVGAKLAMLRALDVTFAAEVAL